MQPTTRLSARTAAVLLSSLAATSLAIAQDAVKLPDAATVLDRSVEAAGGRDAFERFRTFAATGSVEIPSAGLTGSMSMFREAGNYFVAIDLPGIGTTETGVTNGIAWELSPVLGARVKTGDERSQAMRDAAMVLGAAAEWRELFPQVETVGLTTIDGEDAYEVRMTPAEGPPLSVHFSVESGLALRTDLAAPILMGGIPIQVNFSDYREFGGLLVPTVRAVNTAGVTVRQILESVEANGEIPQGRFELPEAVAALVK